MPLCPSAAEQVNSPTPGASLSCWGLTLEGIDQAFLVTRKKIKVTIHGKASLLSSSQ